MKDIVIIGYGGFAKEVAFLIEEINKIKKTYNILGYVSANENEIGIINGKFKVIMSENDLINYNTKLCVAIGIGNPTTNYKIISNLKSKNPKLVFPNLIHPTVVADWDNIFLGEGNIICAGCILTTDIKIGSFNIFNLDITVGHDCAIGDYNVFNPSVNISGGVCIGNKVLLGTGSQILQNLNLVDEVVVGAGGVVIKDLLEPGTYVGVPVKKIK